MEKQTNSRETIANQKDKNSLKKELKKRETWNLELYC